MTSLPSPATAADILDKHRDTIDKMRPPATSFRELLSAGIEVAHTSHFQGLNDRDEVEPGKLIVALGAEFLEHLSRFRGKPLPESIKFTPKRPKSGLQYPPGGPLMRANKARRSVSGRLATALLAITGCLVSATLAAAPQSPVEPVENRDVYYPGTEALGNDEMRVTACGTGMPNARPAQAAACFLVELGNGDKFIFDIGTGSAERLSAMKIPFDFLDKVFIGHLHADHFGDLDALWVGGVLANRQRPLRVWGPSGPEKRLGTAHAVEHMKEMFAWDYASRQGNVNTVGFEVEVTEFDYKLVNQVIYEENGVVIRSIPAIHALDGPVSFILEWNGLKFAFSSDTFPNTWWREYAQGADLAIHECFITPWDLVNKQKWPVADALNVSTQVHTSPAQFGKVMSQIKPRMAVLMIAHMEPFRDRHKGATPGSA